MRSNSKTSAKVKLANTSITAPLITDENNNEQLEFETTASVCVWLYVFFFLRQL